MPIHPVDAAVAALAEQQHSVFSVQQALAAGANHSLIRRRVASRRWLRHAPAVLGLPGVRSTFHRQLWISVLDAGPAAMTTHEAVPRLHGIDVFPARAAILIPHGHHHVSGTAVVHQSRRMPVPIAVDGLPSAPLARALCDLAAGYGAMRLGRAVDDAHLRKLCSITQVQRTFLGLAVRGRPGVEVMRRVLDARVDGYVPSRSILEQGLDAILETIPGVTVLKEFDLSRGAGSRSWSTA